MNLKGLTSVLLLIKFAEVSGRILPISCRTLSLDRRFQLPILGVHNGWNNESKNVFGRTRNGFCRFK